MVLSNLLSNFINQLLPALHNHQNLIRTLLFSLPNVYRLHIIDNIATGYQFSVQQHITKFQSYFFRWSCNIENCKLDHSCDHQTHIKPIISVQLLYFQNQILDQDEKFGRQSLQFFSLYVHFLQYLFLTFDDIILSMLSKTLRRHFQEFSDLSPWVNEEREKNSRSIQPQQKPKIKKMKSIPPRIKSNTLKKHTQRNTIKVTDYELPPLNKKTQRMKQYNSLTIQPPQGRLIRNISSHKISSQQELNTNLSGRELRKFRLSGKKYDMLPQQKTSKWPTEQTRPQQSYMSNNTMLLFTKSKDDILKRVLNQIQGRIKEINIYE